MGSMAVAHKHGERFTKEDKLRVLAAYQVLGSQRKAAEATGVSQQVISYWVNNDDEFVALMEEMQAQVDRELPVVFSGLIALAAEGLAGRLADPDEVRKMGVNQIATLIGVLTDKRQILLSRPTSISAKQGSVEDQLQKNADALIATVRKAA